MAKEKNAGRGKKLLYFLSLMGNEEREELALWLASPLHGRSPQFADVLALVLLHLAGEPGETEGLRAADFSGVIAPDRPMNAKKEAYIWIRLAQFQTALYGYLVWRQTRRDTGAVRGNLLKELRDQGWEKYIPWAYRGALQALPQPVQAGHFRARLDLEVTLNGYLASQGKTGQDKHLGEVHGALDAYFVLQKLKYACAGLLTGAAGADPSQAPLLAAVLALVEAQLDRLPAVTQAYWHAFRMLQLELAGSAEAEAHFLAFDALFTRPADFAAEEAMDLFVHAQNFCVLRYRRGISGYLNQLQELYDRVLTSKVAFKEGLMSMQFYKNTVELMCKLKKFAWAETFVARYRDRIAHDPACLSYTYNLAVLRFFQADFQAVVDLLYNEIGSLERMQLGLGARVYLCRSLWEIREYEWLISVLKAFEQHLRRADEIGVAERKRYRGFARYLRKAALAATGNPDLVRQGLARVLAEIDKKEAPELYKWLRAKIAAMV